jgi:hypothetical protein
MEQSIQLIEEQIRDIESRMLDPAFCEGTASTCSRISGYYRPVECWNAGKAGEYSQRLSYSIDVS